MFILILIATLYSIELLCFRWSNMAVISPLYNMYLVIVY